jgi:hypothetical protein
MTSQTAAGHVGTTVALVSGAGLRRGWGSAVTEMTSQAKTFPRRMTRRYPARPSVLAEQSGHRQVRGRAAANGYEITECAGCRTS